MQFRVVSILVFLELALGFHSLCQTTFRSSEFQSLFSWNLPSDRIRPLAATFSYQVSILVFLELALGSLKRN